jgi:hypothetical protein
VFDVHGKPVEMIETTGVRQGKVMSEHSFAFEEPTKSHRNCRPIYILWERFSRIELREAQAYRKASELTISLFPQPLVFAIGDSSLLKP